MKIIVKYTDNSRGEREIEPRKCPECGGIEHYYISGYDYIEIICAKCGYQLEDCTIGED